MKITPAKKIDDCCLCSDQECLIRNSGLGIPEACPLKDYKGWQDKPDILTKIIEDTKLLDLGRKAVEDELIEWRDNRLSQFNRGNGLVIREKNGDDSSIIRFGMEVALKIALKAIYKNLSGHKAILPEE